MSRRLSISLLALLLLAAVAAGSAFSVLWLGRAWLACLITASLVAAAWALLRRRLGREAIRLEQRIAGHDASLSSEFSAIPRQLDAAAEVNARQVSRMEESRHQLEVLLEGIQDCVISVDAGGRVQWANALLGRLMAAHGLGGVVRLGRSLVHSLRDPVLLSAVQTAGESHQSVEVRSATLLPGRIFDITASPLPGGGAVAVLHDVTRTEALERTQREFVANVSHELRTPLTSIMGYVETLLDTEPLQEHAREFLETVHKNATRMNRLTEDLLLLARVEDADRQLHRQAVPADRLLEDALKTARGSALDAQAEFDVAETTSLPVLADEHAVLQVLGNLLENAVKYGGMGDDGRARVVLSAAPLGDSFVEFRIRDFGAGIAQEHQERIFERFYRVDKARSRESGGTGLGLAIAKHLIDEHGGELAVISAIGQGSTFRFTLPRQGSPRTEVATHSAAEPKTG